MERPLTVGQLAHATGVPAKTIRYYEQVGVLPEPRRSGAGYRHYSRSDVHRGLGQMTQDTYGKPYLHTFLAFIKS